MGDIYRSYYTKNNNITSYMISMIRPSESDRILEPCGGSGMFIDALLRYDPDLKIDTCDINPSAVQTMQNKYAVFDNVSVRETDTLTDPLFDGFSKDGYYDKVIGNPPYGGWQEYGRRAELKKKYNGFYVKETYSLFLLRCISLLKEKGILSFIVPDTFLFLHMHKQLRKYLLQHTLIKEIAIFPSRFFPDVSFGYSNLCIITLQRRSSADELRGNRFSVIKGLRSDDDLKRLSKNEMPGYAKCSASLQHEVLLNPDCAFFVGDEAINRALVQCEASLADMAACVTGIYCGNNKRFLALAGSGKGLPADYPRIDVSQIDYEHMSNGPVNNSKRYVPIVKGCSSTGYIRTADEWLIEWTEAALDHYRNDKKARFQNSQYYFRTGIALPMVKSSKIKAALMKEKVFDQSIVGIFPYDEKYLYYLLAYLNSSTANRFIHTINPTANNSANYLKKMPVHIPSKDELAFIDDMVRTIIDTGDTERYHHEIDAFFESRLLSNSPVAPQ